MLLLMLIVLYGPTCGAAENFSLSTPLCTAVDEGAVEKVQALLESDADANEACSFANSDYPLLVAARIGNVDIGELLLSHGADVNVAGFLGYTPLLRAGEGLHLEFMELLLQRRPDLNARLMDLGALNLNIGLDVLSLTTAAYLRKFLIASASEQQAMDETYAAILDILSEHCFDFERFGAASVTRLHSEGHHDEAMQVTRLVKERNESC